MQKKFGFIATVGLFFLIACSNDAGDKNNSVEVAEEKNEQRADSLDRGDDMEDDTEFLVESASGGLMEVQLGEYASQNAVSADVKAFGQRMVTDHGKANEELKAMAAAKNIALPANPGTEHQNHITDLRQKTGADFDKAYMRMMVDDHKEDIEDFEEAAKNAKDPEIKAFAAKHVPILQQHLQQAQTIHDKIK
ncbi:DUF4142 domain-containing protein [Flavisolibacter sp. BT320]|nr:DUF4142 domain-containing protein [Flavisolibacter longurius]